MECQFIGAAHVITSVRLVRAIKRPLKYCSPDNHRSSVCTRYLPVLHIVGRSVDPDFKPWCEFMVQFDLEVHLLQLVSLDNAFLMVIVGTYIIV